MDLLLGCLTWVAELSFHLLLATPTLFLRNRYREHVCQPEESPPRISLNTTIHTPPLAQSSTLSQMSYDGDNRPNTALRRLQEGLKTHRLPSNERPQVFVPQPILQKLVEDNVEDILREESIVSVEKIPSFAQLISSRATKLFAILVEAKKEKDIIELLKEGIQDDNLPFVKSMRSCSSCSVLHTRQGQHIQALTKWDTHAIKHFEPKQYRMLCPSFRRGEHYELDELHILPFIAHNTGSDYKPAAAGGYGEVSQEYIHRYHHEFGDKSSPDEIAVAVKRMFHDTDFEPERKVYRDLGPSSHRHLIDLLFTYTKHNKCHFVFLWADGSLKDYWERNPRPELSPGYLKWSLQQMAGIASGLAFFHEFTNTATGQPRFGRHGDIKAQNILWFRRENVLKIADLGLASVRGRGSRSNIHPSTVVVSPTYSPPDVERRLLVSRKWDIWSLGCLYMEFITYLVLGCDAIAEFSQQRCSVSSEYPELSTDTFYSASYETVNPSVADWADKLKDNPRCTAIMHDILDLVVNTMIRIDPDERSTALEVCEELNRMLRRAEGEANYLLEPKPLAQRVLSNYARPRRFCHLQIRQSSGTRDFVGASRSQSWNY